MTNKDIAEVTHKAYKLLLSEVTNKARIGCDTSAKDVMRYMTAENICLRNLGYMVNDGGRVVKFKPNKDPFMQLVFKAKDGDIKAAEQLLELLSK